jgi:hypothetical protein
MRQFKLSVSDLRERVREGIEQVRQAQEAETSEAVETQ